MDVHEYPSREELLVGRGGGDAPREVTVLIPLFFLVSWDLDIS